jgi:hypothetical protein
LEKIHVRGYSPGYLIAENVLNFHSSDSDGLGTYEEI